MSTMKARRESEEFKALCGELSAVERAEVVKRIRAGDKYMDIAMDWLISEDRVQDIATQEGIYRRNSKYSARAATKS